MKENLGEFLIGHLGASGWGGTVFMFSSSVGRRGF